jgi:hypothetical protein
MIGVISPVLQRTEPVPTAVKLAVGLAQLRVAELGLMLTVGTF